MDRNVLSAFRIQVTLGLSLLTSAVVLGLHVNTSDTNKGSCTHGLSL